MKSGKSENVNWHEEPTENQKMLIDTRNRPTDQPLIEQETGPLKSFVGAQRNVL